ncbi:receptor kinase-like protein Xa21 [Citrus sinensis]|uniref:receptor kinase-like protein Xa21 n=1 Tax=Citrus sinensis TaxID=2711 RepID=UPI002277759A|nr:receptor kinase-like protein Xa21 [Citrus sinensis]
MESSQLIGTIPPLIGETPNLQLLNIGGNHLQGSILSSLGNLTLQTYLFNNLQGNIPSSLANCKSLLGLSVSHNKLTSTLPQQILSVTTLSLYLELDNNLLNGSLPPEVGNLKNLLRLHVSGNRFSELSKATNNFSPANKIREGGFNIVYNVAMKVANLKQKEASRSFAAEFNALRNIRHRNLIKIITICSSIDFEGFDFKAIVYEYMQNGNLEQWLH